jgi:PAS domain-containing protein
VLEEIDVGIFAFDDAPALRLVNRAGARLLQRPPSQLLGRNAEPLGMAGLLEGETPRRVDTDFGGQGGPYELRRSQFRREGCRTPWWCWPTSGGWCARRNAQPGSASCGC